MSSQSTRNNSAQWRASDIRHHLHPFTDHKTLAAEGGSRIMTEADGVYITDSEGNRILDAMAGLWCVNVGYGRAARISPPDLRKLKRLHEEMCVAMASGDVERYLPRNQEFHFTIYAAANLPTALRMVESMWLQIGPVLNFLLTTDARAERSPPPKKGASIFEKHNLSAIRALKRKDGPAARQAIASDISDSADFFLSLEHFRLPPAL